jgi:hypothetical protein
LHLWVEDSWGLGTGFLLNERQQTCLQSIFAFFRKINEAEGLEPALSRPHGKHDLRFFADDGLAKVEDKFDFELFVERLLHVHEAARGRELMQFTAYFTAVGQPHEREDRSPELDAKRASLLLAGGPGPYRRWNQRDRVWRLRHRE